MRICEKILRSLDLKFDDIAITLEEMKDLNTMFVEELVGSLQAHEQKVNIRSEGDTSKGGRHIGDKRKVKDLAEEDLDILNPEEEAKADNEDIDNRTTSHKEEDTKEVVAVTTTIRILIKETLSVILAISLDQSVWYLDSATSNYMTSKKNLFIELDEKVQKEISFGDFSKVPVRGRGDVLIKRNTGDHAFISNVYYVPDMETNILNLRQLVDKHYQISLRDKQTVISDARVNSTREIWKARTTGKHVKVVEEGNKKLNATGGTNTAVSTETNMTNDSSSIQGEGEAGKIKEKGKDPLVEKERGSNQGDGGQSGKEKDKEMKQGGGFKQPKSKKNNKGLSLLEDGITCLS
ncbi:uncharacterized protein LOC131148315 [Malania oleifera]|uniref:uncharacterized protein LOC131148315 n=1 Tax=Malania oleifera TaxID=397392 RepID=UPI0025ADF284|nr:uncharacterized protein LOC131148315 [Malania oleifera]